MRGSRTLKCFLFPTLGWSNADRWRARSGKVDSKSPNWATTIFCEILRISFYPMLTLLTEVTFAASQSKSCSSFFLKARRTVFLTTSARWQKALFYRRFCVRCSSLTFGSLIGVVAAALPPPRF